MEKIKSPKNIPLLSKTLLFSLVLFAVLTSSNLKLNQIEIPFGFPKIIVPEDNPLSEAKIELGKKLFLKSCFLGIPLFPVQLVTTLNMHSRMD